MDPPQRLSPHESLQPFNPERKLAKGQRTLTPQPSRSQARVVCLRRIIGSINDAQVFPAATLHRGLDETAAAAEAYDAVGCHNDEFIAAALSDYDRLLGLNLGSYPEPGESIDASPSGPLGRL